MADMYGFNTGNRFGRDAFGGGEEGEAAADRALQAHEAMLTPGTRVRQYRYRDNRETGITGVIVGEAGGRRYRVREDGDAAHALTFEIESHNLELV